MLGPVVVRTEDGEQPVGGHHQQALLGALAVSGGHAVTIDELSQVVWGDHPPQSATNTLQTYVSHLRHLLGSEAVVRSDHSYELDLDAVDIDALEFERLVRAAEAAADEPDERWRFATEALGLWRGRPFGDLAEDEAFELETLRLDELRIFATELRLDADLSLGRHESIVPELESVVREHPYREPFWYLLFEALLRSGRRVEALRACHAFREMLTDVGLEPGVELNAVEQRILTGDAGH